MPLILLTGYPSSGKTHRAAQLHDFFRSKIATAAGDDPGTSRLTTALVSDESLGLLDRNAVYRDVRAEKDARAAELSAIKRALGRDVLVIADGLNYIKGFRYQLYCEAKALSTPSCVVHIGTPVDSCRAMNTARLQETSSSLTSPAPYAPDIFDALVARYEEPNGMTRWDSPLFTVLHDDATPPLERIWDALIGSEAGRLKTVKPNQATVLVRPFPPRPLRTQASAHAHRAPQRAPTSSNALYELDRQTQDILSLILAHQRENSASGTVAVPATSTPLELPASPLSLPQLQRLRRQFVALNRQNVGGAGLGTARIGCVFVDYLNDRFQEL
ncbi:MAG: hypothetical protein M1832_002318 [Thelocarpon impressellum]|nr:MAG: hypothetical protein M1832_002318 [Thelocarpon impressellum]